MFSPFISGFCLRKLGYLRKTFACISTIIRCYNAGCPGLQRLASYLQRTPPTGMSPLPTRLLQPQTTMQPYFTSPFYPRLTMQYQQLERPTSPFTQLNPPTSYVQQKLLGPTLRQYQQLERPTSTFTQLKPPTSYVQQKLLAPTPRQYQQLRTPPHQHRYKAHSGQLPNYIKKFHELKSPSTQFAQPVFRGPFSRLGTPSNYQNEFVAMERALTQNSLNTEELLFYLFLQQAM